MTPLRVVTILSGSKYEWQYAERLAKGVKEHLHQPHEFVCYTDQMCHLPEHGPPDHPPSLPHGHAVPLPDLGLTSWWWKTWLFSPEMRTGPVLWLDLDTVIRGPIDFLVGGKEFLILEDVYCAPRWQSSIMYLPATVGSEVWESYVEAGKPQKFPRGEQQFTDEHFNRDHLWALIQREFPGKCLSWKADFVKQKGARDASIIFFHGKPSPHEVDWAEGV